MSQNLKTNRSDNRGGKREGSGRKPPAYETKTLYKRGVPLEVYDLCLSLIDAEILKFKNRKL